MRMETAVVVVLIAAVALSTACAQGNLPEPVQTAVADLAQRLNVSQDSISVAGFEEVTWPDASLGNPREGRMYAQVQTPGYRVNLQAQGQRYEYHTDMGTNVTLVGFEEVGRDRADVAPQAPTTEEEETQARVTAMMRAREHLAQRLEIDPGQVYVAALEEHTWENAALGVEEPGRTYAQVLTPGYRLVLETDSGLFEYHASASGQVKPAGRAEDGADGDAAGPDEGADVGQSARSAEVVAALSDLARRLATDPAEISVAAVEQVQWPNGSLGLPDPGMAYTMALVPGQRIHLEAEGRVFEYRSGQGDSVRYAGIVYPDDAELSLLAMSQTEPEDGNNFFHLQRIDPQTRERETIAEFVSGFVTTPDGGDIVIKRRTSRSGHMLAHVASDGSETELGGAFDYHGIALRHDGEMLAYWSRPSVVDRQARLNILPHPGAGHGAIQPSIPGVQGRLNPGETAWTDDGLAFTVRTDIGAQSFYWTPEDGVTELGSFAVMGWIPRTNSLLIRRSENNREILATFIPGRGETTVLADVPAIRSVDAPAGEQWVVAAISEGGASEVRRIGWGGDMSDLRVLQGANNAAIRVSPLGRMAVAEYIADDVSRVDVMRLTDEVRTTTMSDAAGAAPVLN
ncbi:MAG: hypothetical protein ACOCX2_12480 [Armatimonadota bacterium]